jgi:SagB-type dehydrogenase family enzyme
MMAFRVSDPASLGEPGTETFATTAIEQMIVGRTPSWDDATEGYHEASRAYPGIVDPTVHGMQLLERSPEVRTSAARSTKRHRGVQTVELPRPAFGDARLGDAFVQRRSTRTFGNAPVQLDQLASLLGAAYGVTGTFGVGEQCVRTVPSGGALYPLELYVASCRVAGLDHAIYHYDPLRHVLERLRPVAPERELAELSPYPTLLCPSAAVVVVTAMFWRSRFKYGSRAYRFTLIEAGHVAQNFLLAASALQLAAVPVGGFYDRRVDAFVGANSLHEATLYLLPVGAQPS